MRSVPVALAAALGAIVPGAAAAPGELHRAEASAAAIHGFYDHEGLFPVALLNLSVPHAEVRLEPGPATEAVGSFLWDPQAAELGTIVCVLSGGHLCGLPNYPFQARDSHPSSGRDDPPPSLVIDAPGSAVVVRGADERAEASARGAVAGADVSRLAALPMTPQQSAAAETLAASLGPHGRAPDGYLVAVRSASSEAVARSGASARASAGSVVHGLELLGGLITVGAARSEVAASTAGGAAAVSQLGAVRVGDLRAVIGRDGLRIADRSIGREELVTLSAALDRALGAAGFRLSPGASSERRTPRGASAEAYAFSLDVRRSNLPSELPEGTAGADVLRVPMAYASASAEGTPLPAATSGEAPPVEPAPAAAGPPEPVPAPARPGRPDPGVTDDGGPPATPPETPPPAAATPLAGFLAGKIPAGAVVLTALLAVLLVIGLTVLKSAEVLSE